LTGFQERVRVLSKRSRLKRFNRTREREFRVFICKRKERRAVLSGEGKCESDTNEEKDERKLEKSRVFKIFVL
jgi:hypothetical protein